MRLDARRCSAWPNRLGTDPDAPLPCACWCARSYVLVSRETFRAGLTDSCGRDGCEPPEDS